MTRATATTIDYSIPAMREWRKLPEHIHGEVINGRLYILPDPTLYHQEVAGELFVHLWTFAKETGIGKAYMQRSSVVLNNGSKVVSPDVVFRKNDNPDCNVNMEKGLFGPPDLIIEILSSNKKHDRVLKLNLYEQAGVREYWIVDPNTKDSWGYFLEDGKYDEQLTMNSKIHLRTLNKQITF